MEESEIIEEHRKLFTVKYIDKAAKNSTLVDDETIKAAVSIISGNHNTHPKLKTNDIKKRAKKQKWILASFPLEPGPILCKYVGKGNNLSGEVRKIYNMFQIVVTFYCVKQKCSVHFSGFRTQKQ